MNMSKLYRLCMLFVAGFALTVLSACSSILPAPLPQASYYSLDAGVPNDRSATEAKSTVDKPTMLINMPHAAAGYESQHIIYTRQAHKLEYFSRNEWVDTPARMLAPLLLTALENTHAFQAVVLAPSNIIGDFRLDSEVVRLQQNFDSQPSHVRFTLRVYLVNNLTRKVIAWREFDETTIAKSDDPFGGVVAANQVVQIVLQKVTDFCSEALLIARDSGKATQ